MKHELPGPYLVLRISYFDPYQVQSTKYKVRLSPKGGEPLYLNQFLILAALLFSLGIYGLLVRRNAVMVLLSIELMLNAVNINLVAFEAFLRNAEVGGQIFAIFVITVAAAEVGVGLAIILMIFRNRTSANIDELDLMKW